MPDFNTRPVTGPEEKAISAYTNHYRSCFHCTDNPVPSIGPILCEEGKFLAYDVRYYLGKHDDRILSELELKNYGTHVQPIYDGEDMDLINELFPSTNSNSDLANRSVHEHGNTTPLSNYHESHVYPREPTEQERVAIKAYFEHAKYCSACREPILIADRRWRLCCDGRAFARHVQQYICLSNGVICTNGRKRFPLRLSAETQQLMTNLLRAINNGLDVTDPAHNTQAPKLPVLPQHKTASPSPSVEDMQSSNNANNNNNNNNNNNMPMTSIPSAWWASFAANSGTPPTVVPGQACPPWMLMMPPFQPVPNNNGNNNGNGANNWKDFHAPNTFSSQG